MKRSHIYLLIVVTIALLFGWGIWHIYRAFKVSMEPSVCVCTVSPSASDEAAQAITHLIEQSTLEKKGSLASVAQSVYKEFPFCTAISCRQQPSGLVQARIEIDEPFCAVNDDALATAHGLLVSKMVYADQELIGLPHVRMPTAQIGGSLSPQMLAFLRHIPESFFSTHKVVYRSDDEIVLVSREVPKNTLSQEETAFKEISKSTLSLVDAAGHDMFQRNVSKYETTKRALAKNEVAAPLQPIYLSAVNTVIDHDLLTRCDSVLADYEQQKTTSKKKARTALVLDLRFDKQIILYPHMGGQVHG